MILMSISDETNSLRRRIDTYTRALDVPVGSEDYMQHLAMQMWVASGDLKRIRAVGIIDREVVDALEEDMQKLNKKYELRMRGIR